MSLNDKLDQLEPRERQLLLALGVFLAVGVLVLLPGLVWAQVANKREAVAELRDAIGEIQSSRAKIAEVTAARKSILDRYSRPAPPLSSFLAGLAKGSELDIPEIQDADVKAHGKKYEEHLTNITLRKVSMYNSVKFMESIALSPHPVSISRLIINKRGAEEDSFDMQMTVSAFERKLIAKKPSRSTGPDTEAQ